MVCLQESRICESTKIADEFFSFLKPTQELNMLNPEEVRLMTYIYKKLNAMYFNNCKDIAVKYRKTIEYGKKAERYEEIINNSVFLEQMYDENIMKQLKALCINKTDLNYVYKALYFAYQELKVYDLATEYRRKIKL